MKKLLSFFLVISAMLSVGISAFASGTQKLSSVVFDPDKTYSPDDIVVLDDGWSFTDDTDEDFHNAGNYILKATDGTDTVSWEFIIKQKEILPPELLLNNVTFDPDKHYTLFTLYKVYDWNGTRFWGDISPQSYKDPGEYNIYVIADSNYYFKGKPSRYTDVFVILPDVTPAPEPTHEPAPSPSSSPVPVKETAEPSLDENNSEVNIALPPESYEKERQSSAPLIAAAVLCAAGVCVAVYFLGKKN